MWVCGNDESWWLLCWLELVLPLSFSTSVFYRHNTTQERGVYNQDFRQTTPHRREMLTKGLAKTTQMPNTRRESSYCEHMKNIRKLLRNSPYISDSCSSAPVLGPIRMTNNYKMWEVSVLSVYLAIVSAEIHYLRAICVSGPIKSKQLKSCLINTNFT